MKRLLLPIDESMRSLKAINYVKNHISPLDYEIVIIMVNENVNYTDSHEQEEKAFAELYKKLELVKESLPEYNVFTRAEIGKAGQRIVKCARESGAELIAMTKSSGDDKRSQLGHTTEYVLVNAPCNVMIVSEERAKGEFRGLVYKTASATVSLRGQLSLKQSECLIPSVSVDCIYQIEVIRGRIRFSHRSYNPETGNWDREPRTGEEPNYEIIAGQKMSIPVKANSVDGKADRIRINNKSMKTEAVFKYRIVADK